MPQVPNLNKPIKVDFSNSLYPKSSLGFDFPKPNDRIKDKQLLEDMGSYAKVWCKKCDAYGHHTDS